MIFICPFLPSFSLCSQLHLCCSVTLSFALSSLTPSLLSLLSHYAHVPNMSCIEVLTPPITHRAVLGVQILIDGHMHSVNCLQLQGKGQADDTTTL